MKELNEFIEKHYREKFSFKSLLELVEQELEGFQGLLVETAKTGRGKEMPASQRRKMMIAWDGIPEIAISEIGFSDAATSATGAGISGSGRRALERWAQELGAGQDLAKVIKNMESFYNGGIEDISRSNLSHGKRIARTLAHLTIYKTLTKIVNEFNASSAGFSFESFVAVLLGGIQVETGQNSIADLEAKGVPWSLKLYAEKAVKAGGSYSQLVDDLSGRGSIVYEEDGSGAMKYLVVEKTLEGEGLDQEGNLRWTTFTFTLDNVMAILEKADPESKEAIRLPAEYGTEEFAQKIKQSKVSAEEIAGPNGENLLARIEGEIREVLAAQGLDEASIGEFVEFVSSLPRNTLKPKSGMPINKKTINKSWGKWDQLKDLVSSIDAKINSEYAEVASGKAQKKMVADVDWLGTEESARIYASLTSKEAKMDALLHTYGILGPKKLQFEVRRGQLHDEKFKGIAKGQDLGTILIGTKHVAELLYGARKELNASIFEIFSELKKLKDNIEAYFAGGLENDNRAGGAIENTKVISGKTEELRDK